MTFPDPQSDDTASTSAQGLPQRQSQPPVDQQSPWPQQQPLYPSQPGEAVWPPPAYTGPVQETPPFSIWFNHNHTRGLIRRVTDLRVGSAWFTDDGLLLDGQAVQPMEIRLAILLPLVFLCLIAALFAEIIMDAGFRKPKRLMVPWADVEKVAYTRNRKMACILFNAPTFFGSAKVKKFSLAFPLNRNYADVFIEACRHYVGDRVEERNRIPYSQNPFLLLAIIVGIVAAIFVFGYYSSSPH